MQLIQVDSGVTNANQGDMTDLPSNTTATGVNSMLESSSVLHQYILEEIRDCLTPAPRLRHRADLHDAGSGTRRFDYLEQDEPAASPETRMEKRRRRRLRQARQARQAAASNLSGLRSPVSGLNKTIEAIMELSEAKKLAGLGMKVEFLLTRAKRQEQREAAMAAIPIGVQYGTLGPKDQARMNDAFVQLFRALGFDQPEDFFPMPDLSTPPPSPPPPKAAEAIALKGADLTPSQKDALAQQFGLPAATAGELQPGHDPTGAGTNDDAPPAAASPASPPRPLPSNVIPDSNPPDPTAGGFAGARTGVPGQASTRLSEAMDAGQDSSPPPAAPTGAA